ncbi:zinc finger HIT domain-containing protein 3 isoform X2 [Macrotis lagotis]|uniref:zinc finger HIT domain-containing protein 3 isoform X2 n=1 Tax=Macrotis lagotis TaxID=92651 RepID=UPI003D69B8A2
MASRGPRGACAVCEGEPKYRCPACRVPYCSVPCCRKHKERCASKPAPVLRNGDLSTRLGSAALLEDKGNDWSVADILDSDDEKDKVSIQKLKDLGDSKELRNLLNNPHLRQLLVSIDQADDKETLMKSHMQEPLFVEFADCCLRIVEPPEKENALDVEG